MVLPNQLELLKLFSSFLVEAGLSTVSIKNYLSDLRHFLSFCATLPTLSREGSGEGLPTVGDIFHNLNKFLTPYLEDQKATFTPKSTTNRRLASIRRFATFLSVKFDVRDIFTQQNISNNDKQSNQITNLSGFQRSDQTASPSPTISQTSTVIPAKAGIHQINPLPILSSVKILEQFKNSLEREKKTHSTIKNYLSDLNHFFLWTANQTPFTIQNLSNILSEPQLQAYITYLKLSHTSTSVINRRQSSIKKLARFCFAEKYIPTNPFEIKLPPPKIAPLAWIERLSHKPKKTSNAPKGRLAVWYDKYNSLSWTPYLNIAILVLATTAMAIFAYNQIIGQARPSAAATALTPPKRQLSFQGRLTDSSGTPITTAVSVVFKLFNALTGPTQLYTSGTCSITPDQDGIFNTLIGDTVCGTEITSSVFTDNRDIFLEVTIGAETLSPRQPIATVGYALNSETLQGYPASASATINTVPIVDNSGNITIAAASPSIISSAGTFTVQGQVLSLKTGANSGGDVIFQPDALGSGQILALGGTTTEDSFRVTNANLTSGSLVSGYVGNDTATGRLLSLTSGSTETDRFYVAADGRTKINAASATGWPALTINQTSTGDLFTASASGTNKLIIKNDGSVGINTTGPDAKIDSLATSGEQLRLTYTDGTVYTGFTVDSGGDLSIDATGGDVTLATGDNLNLTAAGDLIFGGTTSLAETTAPTDSGAYLVGANDEFDNSASANVQDVLDDLDAAITSGVSGGASNWTVAAGSIYPKNSTLDAFIGGTASSSAKFAFLNVNSGTPTASISGSVSNVATFLDGNGNLSTTNRRDLTIGNSSTYNTTGNVLINPNGTGNVGIGTTGPDAKLDSLATTEQLRLTYTDGTVYSSHTVDSSGNLTINNTGTKTIIADDLQVTGGDILDSNGNESIRFGTTASAVNEATLTNAATGGIVTLAATGGDTDVALSIDSKGADALNLNGTATGDVNLAGGYGGTGCTVTNSNGNLSCNGTITGTIAGTIPWSEIDAPTGNLSLAHAGYTTAFTFDSVTTADAFALSSSSLTTGTILDLSSTSTAGGASGLSKVLDITRSGTNANASHTAYGLYSAVTNTGTTSTNVGGYFSASGATNNYGLIVGSGNVGIGTTGPDAKLDSLATTEQLRLTYTDGTVYTGFTVNSGGDLSIDATGGDVTLASGDNLNLTAAGDLIFGGTTSLAETTAPTDSGAYLVGANDEFDNSNSTNVQAVLNDLDAAITTGGGSSIWSLTSGVIHPTTATNDLAIGGTTLAASMFGIDESTGNFYFGSDNSANPTLNFEATDGDAGEFGFNTNDSFYFSNANVGIGDTTPSYFLDVAGDVNLTGTLGIGTATPNSTRNINAAITFTDAAGYGIYNAVTVTGTLTANRNNIGAYNLIASTADDASFTNNLYGSYNQVTNSNGTTYDVAYGSYNYIVNNDTTLTATTSAAMFGYVLNNVTGTLTNAYGGQGQVINNTTGTIANARGLYGYVRNDDGTMTNGYGVYGVTQQTVAGGVMTNGYGGWFDVDQTAGTITNGYGVYIGDVGATTNQYGLYQAGSTDTNYFAGNVGIGDTTPLSLFTVGSGDLFQVNSSGAIAAVVGITNTGVVTSTDGIINLNVSSNFATNINTGTSTGAVTIGGNSNTVEIDSSDWDISTTGAMTGIGAITANGNFTSTGTTINLGTATGTIGNWTQVFDSAGDRLYMGFSGAQGGDIQFYANGTSTGASQIFAENGAVTAGLYNGQTISSVANFTGTVNIASYATVSASLAIGTANATAGFGNLNLSGSFTSGGAGLFQVNSTGNIVKINNVTTSFPASQGAANSTLINNGSGVLSWLDPAAASGTAGYWTRSSSHIYPTNINDPVAIGFSTAMTNPGMGGGLTALQVDGDILPLVDDDAYLGRASSAWKRLYLSLGINDTTGAEQISIANRQLTGGQWNATTFFRVGDTVNTMPAGGMELFVSGDASVSGTLDVWGNVTVQSGIGKIDVGTVDPPYTINGEKYATYMPGMVGVKEEMIGKITTSEYFSGLGYRALINFESQPKGSDLWLFSKTTDIKNHIDQLSVLLTAAGQAKTWYEIDAPNKILAIYSSTPADISFRLSAPRFDSASWLNTRTSEASGFVLNSPDLDTNQTNANFLGSTIEPELVILADSSFDLKINGRTTKEVSSFFQSIIANLKVGSQVVTTLLADNLTIRTKLISPIADIDQLKVIDATVSGILYADNIKGQTVDRLKSGLDLLSEKYSTASAILADLQTKYASYDSLALSTNNSAPITDTDPLALSPLATTSATIQTLISNDILASGVVFAQSFSSIDTDLFIQPTGDKPIHLLANLLTLYPDGKVVVSGDLLVTGNLFANNLETKTATVSGTLAVGSSTIASDSANFGQLITSGLVIASGHEDLSSTISAQVNSNTTIGTAAIASGSSEIVIANNKVTDDTLIYITPVSDTDNQVLFVKSKQSGIGFTVAVPDNSDQNKQEIFFNYWLVKTK